MAVPEQTPYKEYIGNGVTKIFPLGFDVLEQDHLIVLVNDLESIVGSWSFDATNDTVVFLKAPVNGANIKIRRDTPLKRDSSYQNYNNSFKPKPVDEDFDSIWLKLQEMGVLNWMVNNDVKDLNQYVDSLNEETRNAFLEDIRKQGVSLQQLDIYVDGLYQQLANTAAEKGWLASFIADKNGKNQQQVNDEQQVINNSTIQKVNSIAEMAAIQNPKNGQTVFVQSYYSDTAEGGGNFTYNPTKSSINDWGLVINGWCRNNVIKVTPEMFGAKANTSNHNSSDNFQKMLDTGIEFDVKKENTYYVTKLLQTKGQKFIGVLSISSTRSPFEASIENTLNVSVGYSEPNQNKFMGIYVMASYDLVELLKIKSLGLNTVIHYCQFTNVAEDAQGNYQKLLDNAKTAGLEVILNVEAIGLNEELLKSSIPPLNNYQNLVGFSVVDEPASRRITVSEQDLRISYMRKLTDKKLITVDYPTDTASWLEIFSQNYDLFLCNAYSRYYAGGTLNSKIDRDMQKARIDYGASMKMTGSAKIMPCVQAYTDVRDNPTETAGRYSFDKNQILPVSNIFAKVGNGDVAYFIWDAGFEYKVRNDLDFQNLVSQNCSNRDNRIYRTEPILFGGVNTQTVVNGFNYKQRALTELIQNIAYKDTSNTIDDFPSAGCYPVRLRKGTQETPITTVTNVDISGLGFRQSFSRLVTTKRLLKYFSAWGVLESTVAVNGPLAFEVYSTPDGGYTQTQRYTGGVSPGVPFMFSSLVSNNFDGTGETLVVGLNYTNQEDILENYRRIFYGLLVSTNW